MQVENRKELLELAAKAYGITGNYFEDEFSRGLYCCDEDDCPYTWDSLDSNHDAFRLAVKLGLVINIWPEAKKTYAGNDEGDGFVEGHGTDAFAATRLAITKVAAEIGKNL